MNIFVHMCHFTNGWGQNMPYTKICLGPGKEKAVVQTAMLYHSLLGIYYRHKAVKRHLKKAAQLW